MFQEFFRYHLSSQLKQAMVYIVFASVFLLILAEGYSENISIGWVGKQYNMNSAIVLASKISFMSLLTVFITVAFSNAAALKDFESRFAQILFTYPLQRRGYFLGRFLSSALLSLIPVLAILLGVFTASFFADPTRVSNFSLPAYLTAFFVFGLPNVFIMAALLFPIALKTRQAATGFTSAVFLLLGYQLSVSFIQSLDNQWLSTFLDPFGVTIILLESKYWTIEEINTLSLPMSYELILNRIFWVSLSGFFLFLSARSFSLKLGTKSRKKKSFREIPLENTGLSWSPGKLSPVKQAFGFRAMRQQLWIQFKLELKVLFSSPAFLLLFLFGIINTAGNLINANTMFGTGNQPVTFLMVDAIKSSLYIIIVVVIAFYSGHLIWAERKVKMNELLDASAQANWIPLLSKFLVLSLSVLALMSVNILFAMLIQLGKNHGQIEPMVYFIEIIALDLPYFMSVIALALFLQTLINNQYTGFLIFLLLVLFQVFVWPSFEISSKLLSFGGRPEHIYSDMTRWMPYAEGLFAYTLYWSLWGMLLLVMSGLLWLRGYAHTFGVRLSQAGQRFQGRVAGLTLVLLLAGAGMAFSLYYQSEVLNENPGGEELNQIQAEYEKKYKQYEDLPQPRIVAADYRVAFYPEKRAMNARVLLWVKNQETENIKEIHFSLPALFQTRIKVPGSSLRLRDDKLGYHIYTLGEALQPGDSLKLEVEVSYAARGIENELSLPNLTQNGIFLNNKQFMPIIAYDVGKELQDEEERKKYELPKRKELSKVGEDAGKDGRNNYISSDADWVRLRSIVSTNIGQTALAPGSLKRSWQKDGRAYFEYSLDKPVLNFFAFMSARYKKRVEDWDGVKLEIYYHPGHEYNLDKMMNAMKASLQYYSEAFSPYPHRQARIIEFPRFAKFAQAFPGSMPYSESIGFLADLKDPEDIDVVSYVVAHEMAHQWWAHQLVGANVKGAAMLSETFSQYSALMVMEKMYGKELMGKFLKYEMDNYLRSRSNLEEEPALVAVESESPVYYNKGSVAMYALREYLGEAKLNRLLANFMEKYAYTRAPYPTSRDFIQDLKQILPDSLDYLRVDLFEKVSLYENVLEEATYQRLPNGKYEVSLKVSVQKFHVQGKGKEKNQPLQDYIELAIFGAETEENPKGKLLYRKLRKFTREQNRIRVIVDEEPQKAGIDPDYRLPDRAPENNIKVLSPDPL